MKTASSVKKRRRQSRIDSLAIRYASSLLPRIFTLPPWRTVPDSVVFTHDIERLFAGCLTGKVRVWNLKDKQSVGELTTNP